MKDADHTQCRLEKMLSPDHLRIQMAWIPNQFAIVGNYVRLKQSDGSWDNGWLIAETFTTLDSAYVNERSRDFTRQREASDL